MYIKFLPNLSAICQLHVFLRNGFLVKLHVFLNKSLYGDVVTDKKIEGVFYANFVPDYACFMSVFKGEGIHRWAIIGSLHTGTYCLFFVIQKKSNSNVMKTKPKISLKIVGNKLSLLLDIFLGK